MKKFYAIMLAMVATLALKAQAPQGVNYQAIARNSTGQPLVNQHIGLQFVVHDGSSGGSTEYSETDTATTNEFGLFTVVIGGGTPVTGTFAAIGWGNSTKFLEVDMDPAGGTSYSPYGTSELQSVPYALSTAQWANNGGNIYNVNYSSSDVGIGTNTPQHTLDVSSASLNIANFACSTAGADARILLSNSTGNIGSLGWANFNSTYALTSLGTTDISFGVNNLSTEIMRLQASTGNVGIGTTAPLHALDVYGLDIAVGGIGYSYIFMRANGTDSIDMEYTGSYWSLFINGNGVDYDVANNYFEPYSSNVASCGDAGYVWTSVYATNGTIQTSDLRMKKNVQDLNLGLSTIMQLRPVSYEWKDGTGGDNIGFIAQEVEKIVPQAVVHDYISPTQIAAAKANHKATPEITDPYGMKYSELIPVLTKAIQQQQQMIDELKQEVEKLKNNK
jgi:hypothetical protein